MSNRNDSGTLSLIAAGMSKIDRIRKAQRQPRDLSGRWVGAGANVRWRSNGQDWAGTVEKMLDGQAIVKVRHSDGSTSTTTLQPSTLKVMASKARLSSVSKKYFDENGLTSDYIDQHKRNIEKAAENGGARIDRPDGYSIDVVKPKTKDDDDEEKKKKDKEDNPLLYQLYAPSGRSRGIYSTPSGIDGAIAADSSAPPASVVSSGLEIVEESPQSYTLPKDVIDSIGKGVEALVEYMSDEDLAFFTRLSSGVAITEDDVEILNSFASIAKYLPLLYGEGEGLMWLNKITKKTYEPVDYDFSSGKYEYFVSTNNGVVDLLAVDYDSDKVLSWTGSGFGMDHGSISNYEADSIDPLDNDSARAVSIQLSKYASEGVDAQFNVSDLFPEERNLFAMAMDELDVNFLDTISSLNYNSAERSVDAQYQSRGEGGKFAQTSTSSSKDQGKYFAIVDEVDPTAVLDVVVIASGSNGPEVFRRAYGSWHADPELQAKLTGPTPPNVVYLDSENQIKEVLSQVDAYDFEDENPEATQMSSNTEFALKVMSKEFTEKTTFSSEEIHYFINKAKKFNRMDLVPEDLRVYRSSLASEGLYGEFGEVITASAVSLGNNPLERLDNYWLRGEGSKKIDWSSADAVEYATKVFTKYLGYDRAFAYATLLNSKASV